MKAGNILARALNTMAKAQLAAVLEVSAYPKPGNVHRLRDRGSKRFEHFAAGSVAIGPAIAKAFISGYRACLQGDLSLVGVGRLIRKAVSLQMEAHSAGNTHLGIIMLFVPVASSAAVLAAKGGEENGIGEAALEIIKAATPSDSAELLKAIRMAKPSGLGKPPRGIPDVLKARETSMPLYELLACSARWDGVAEELVSGLKTSLSVGLPELVETYKRTRDVNAAVVHCFLRILAEKPDTLMARNIGLRISPASPIDEAVRLGLREVKPISKRAGEALEVGGLTTERGRRLVEELDAELNSKGPEYNPGTTADITATSIFLALLSGAKLL